MLAGAGGCVGDCWRLLVPAGDCRRVVAGGGGWWSHLLGACRVGGTPPFWGFCEKLS